MKLLPIVRRHFSIAIGACLIASPASANLNGSYAYERVLKNASGQQFGEIYALELGSAGRCRLTVTGPSSHDDIVCRVESTPSSATVHFHRFADANAAKTNNARTYKKDQRLFTLEKGVNKRPEAIRTIWQGLRSTDNQRLASGERFKRAPAKRT
jgi:hypothetical protein